MSMWTSLDPEVITLDPGGTGSVTLRLRNEGDRVEDYRLSVIGAAADWARIDPASVRLYPGTQGEVQVSLSPPRTPQAVAGTIPYGVQVRSAHNQALFDVAEGRVVVAQFHEVRADLFPPTVRGRRTGRTGLTLSNLGNAPLTAELSARDDEDALVFRPEPPLLTVPPGGTATSRLRIRPRRLRLVGSPETYPYVAAAAPLQQGTAEPDAAQELRGVFIRKPLLSRGLLLLLVVLTVLALAATAWYTVSRIRDALDRNAGSQVTGSQNGGAQNTGAQNGGGQNTNTGGQNGATAGDGGRQAAMTVTIAGRGDGGLLTARGGSGTGTSVVVASRPRSGADRDQQWSLVGLGNGQVALVPASLSGSAVLEQRDRSDEIRLGTVAGGSAAVSAGRLPASQRWRLQDAGGGTVTIVNGATGDCLTDRGRNRQSQAASCQDRPGDQQRWTLDRA